MTQLETWENVLQALKEKAVLVTLDDNTPTFFARQKDLIIVKTANSTCRMQVAAFEDLYQEETFYLIESSPQESVDLLKDEEYYGWKHK